MIDDGRKDFNMDYSGYLANLLYFEVKRMLPVTPEEEEAWREMAARKGDWRVQYGGWRGLSDDERDNFRRLGFIGVEIIENILKERNK